jgi:hypothetical protein
MIRPGSCIATIALVALATGAGLAGATSPPSPRPGTFRGHIKPSGHAKVMIHYRHTDGQKMRWYTWHFYRVPLKCESGPAVARWSVKGRQGAFNKYADRTPFGGVHALINPKNRRILYREHVAGKQVGPNEIKGLMRVDGAKVPLRRGGRDKCDSGRLHWRVRR